MSSSSSLSDFSPRIRNRRYPHTSLLSRHPYNRMCPKQLQQKDITSFYIRQAEGLPVIPYYLQNTVYAQLVKQQHAIYKEYCHPNKLKANELMLSTSTDQTTMTPSVEEVDDLYSSLVKDSMKAKLALQDLRLPAVWDIDAKGEHIDISTDHLQLTYTG